MLGHVAVGLKQEKTTGKPCQRSLFLKKSRTWENKGRCKQISEYSIDFPKEIASTFFSLHITMLIKAHADDLMALTDLQFLWKIEQTKEITSTSRPFLGANGEGGKPGIFQFRFDVETFKHESLSWAGGQTNMAEELADKTLMKRTQCWGLWASFKL